MKASEMNTKTNLIIATIVTGGLAGMMFIAEVTRPGLPKEYTFDCDGEGKEYVKECSIVKNFQRCANDAVLLKICKKIEIVK